MKPNFNNRSEIKGLRFFTKEISPYYCCFLHTKKDSGWASMHRISKSFPLKPSLVSILFSGSHWSQISNAIPQKHCHETKLHFYNMNWIWKSSFRNAGSKLCSQSKKRRMCCQASFGCYNSHCLASSTHTQFPKGHANTHVICITNCCTSYYYIELHSNT